MNDVDLLFLSHHLSMEKPTLTTNNNHIALYSTTSKYTEKETEFRRPFVCGWHATSTHLSMATKFKMEIFSRSHWKYESTQNTKKKRDGNKKQFINYCLLVFIVAGFFHKIRSKCDKCQDFLNEKCVVNRRVWRLKITTFFFHLFPSRECENIKINDGNERGKNERWKVFRFSSSTGAWKKIEGNNLSFSNVLLVSFRLIRYSLHDYMPLLLPLLSYRCEFDEIISSAC